jgi:hypothetical protein
MELPDGHCFKVGSSKWWEWVSSDKAESFRFECDFGVKGYRARKETIKARAGSFWYAYKRVEGKLRKRYLGKSDELTLEKLESIAYDLAKPVEPRAEVLPNNAGNYLSKANEQLRASAVERENCYDQLLVQKLRLEQRVKELEELQKLPNDEELKQRKKYEKLLKDARYWREAAEGYQQQAAKLRTELDELHNALCNQQSAKPTSLEGIKIYKLHGRDVVRVDDL